MSKRIVFVGKQQLSLESFDSPHVGPNQVKVRGLCSLISTGTENIVFNRLFAEGTHWAQWVQYPFYPGYSHIGDVVEAGSEVAGLNIGDRVATWTGHASEHVIDADQCAVVPKSIAPESAAWFALAKIAFYGARAADYRLGDSVLIIGAGPIGQMSARWAAAAGAETVMVVDPLASRLKIAELGGATATIALRCDECEDAVRQANNGQLPRVVIDVTGQAAVFSEALRLAADRGTVVLLGDTGFPSEQRLSADVIRRGLTIIGAHGTHDDSTWSHLTVTRLFSSLVASGRFKLGGINTHTFQPEQAAEAYEMLNNRRGDSMGVCFDWSKQ